MGRCNDEQSPERPTLRPQQRGRNDGAILSTSTRDHLPRTLGSLATPCVTHSCVARFQRSCFTVSRRRSRWVRTTLPPEHHIPCPPAPARDSPLSFAMRRLRQGSGGVQYELANQPTHAHTRAFIAHQTPHSHVVCNSRRVPHVALRREARYARAPASDAALHGPRPGAEDAASPRPVHHLFPLVHHLRTHTGSLARQQNSPIKREDLRRRPASRRASPASRRVPSAAAASSRRSPSRSPTTATRSRCSRATRRSASSTSWPRRR